MRYLPTKIKYNAVFPNSAGLSIIECTVAIGLLALLVFAAAKTFTAWFDSASALKDAGTRNDIKSYLLHSVDCPKTVASLGANCDGVSEVYLRNGNNLAIKATNAGVNYFSNYGIKVTCTTDANFYTFDIRVGKYSDSTGTTLIKDYSPLFTLAPFICRL